MDADSATLTSAVDPAQWLAQSRVTLLAESGFTPRDLQRAVRRNRQLIHARRVKHLLIDGQVREVVTQDNDASLRAVELVYKLAGVEAPKAQSAVTTSGVEVVIEDGRIIVRAVSK